MQGMKAVQLLQVVWEHTCADLGGETVQATGISPPNLFESGFCHLLGWTFGAAEGRLVCTLFAIGVSLV